MVSFEIGEVLSRALQITWKHKVLWLFSALPTLLSFLIFPIVFMPIIMGSDPSGSLTFLEEPLYIALFIGTSFFISILSLVLSVVSTSSVTLGVVRAEGGVERLQIKELFNDGGHYWWRILGIMLLIGVGVSAIFFVIFACLALFGAVTAGIGFICAQPLIILMYPVMMVLYGIIEESQAAAVVDDLGVIEAISQGWELVKANFWRILLVSLIVYLGISFLSSIVILPFMTPFFFIPFLAENRQFEFTPRTMMLMMGAFGMILIPVMALVQGITITFMKSTYTLVYLRLTKPKDDEQVVPLEANA